MIVPRVWGYGGLSGFSHIARIFWLFLISSGLSGMRVDSREVEFSRDGEEDGAHSGYSGVASGLAFGGLEEAVEGFDEAVGLAALCPSDDAGAMVEFG